MISRESAWETFRRLEVKSLYKKQEYFTLAPHATSSRHSFGSAGEHKGHKACTEPAEVYTKVFKVFLRDLCALRVQIFFGSSELGLKR